MTSSDSKLLASDGFNTWSYADIVVARIRGFEIPSVTEATSECIGFIVATTSRFDEKVLL